MGKGNLWEKFRDVLCTTFQAGLWNFIRCGKRNASLESRPSPPATPLERCPLLSQSNIPPFSTAMHTKHPNERDATPTNSSRRELLIAGRADPTGQYRRFLTGQTSGRAPPLPSPSLSQDPPDPATFP